MILFFSSFEIINVAIPDQKAFFWIAAFIAGAAAVNLYGVKRFLANDLNAFSIKDNPAFRKGPRSLPKNRPIFLF